MVEPHLFTIFGASGDLTTRKLVPALYHLMRRDDGLRRLHLLGTARSELSDADFRDQISQALREAGFEESELSDWCAGHVHYQSLGPSGDDYAALGRRMAAIESAAGLPGNRVYYLALPPKAFPGTIEGIGRAGLHNGAGDSSDGGGAGSGRAFAGSTDRGAGSSGDRAGSSAEGDRSSGDAGDGSSGGARRGSDGGAGDRIRDSAGNGTAASPWTRLVIEKPFGRDLESALALNNLVHRYFDESQIFRIDHYLGKETVQNLLVFRFANALFESAWHRGQIDKIEISVHEKLGVESRAGYYDESGALRDMIQNHLTQLLSLVAMEAPTRFTADSIRREKIKVLESVTPIDPADVVFGQYSAGEVEGERVVGYRDEEGVAGYSTTPTYVQIRMRVANWRWEGVPFILTTGKRMPERRTQIVIHFKRAPVSIFQPFEDTCDVHSNVLVITLQPNEGFDLQFEVKRPRMPLRLDSKTLRFRYGEEFGRLPDAYETLLLDVIQGDQTLFVHADEVINSWQLYTPLLEAELPVHLYPAGEAGPNVAFITHPTEPQRA